LGALLTIAGARGNVAAAGWLGARCLSAPRVHPRRNEFLVGGATLVVDGLFASSRAATQDRP